MVILRSGTLHHTASVNTFDDVFQGHLKGQSELDKLHCLDTSGKCRSSIQQFVAPAFVKLENNRQALEFLYHDPYAKKYDGAFYLLSIYFLEVQ
ncbi:hypothetical protein DSO57_1022727 [Entomophthora muscae]|uniref:Uncharacterized protein n=1 Tax=Entomophthora muscae TaxID=34485 RepID=A0ACC2S4X7_9FUNG|nr:hypothetical protein DSO57_1022727 [Entomophthora muscae]